MLAVRDRLDIDGRQVLQEIGYYTKRKPPARILSLVDEYIENVNYLISPSYSGVVRDIKSVQGSRVVIEGSVVFESEVLAQLLERCDQVAVFALTIGGHLEETVDQLTDNGLVVQASVLDAIGSAAVESVADFVYGTIREIARARGLYTSRRFSPGYCDWEVGQQKKVFRTVNGDSAGIRLTDGCLMLPRKSISGIIGIGPKEIANYNPCKGCDKVDCIGRR